MWPCRGSGGQLLPVMAWPFISWLLTYHVCHSYWSWVSCIHSPSSVSQSGHVPHNLPTQLSNTVTMSPIYQVEPNLPNLKMDVACSSVMLVYDYTVSSPRRTLDQAACFAHETSTINRLREKQTKISINKELVIYMQLILQTCLTFSAWSLAFSSSSAWSLCLAASIASWRAQTKSGSAIWW